MAQENQKTYTQAEVDALLAEKDTQLAEAEKLIEEQQKALSNQETVATELPVVTVGKKKYKVVAPRFIVDGKTLTAADLQKDPELAKRLVEKGSSVLVPLS